jgi:psiF repeat
VGEAEPQIELPRKERESMTRISQKSLLVVTLLSLAMSAGLPAKAVAHNQGPSQQDKMKACNNLADNKGLKGDDRKNFMQDCLSKAGNQQPTQMSQQDKMNTCKNLADRKNLTGNDRRSFIKDCMNKANPK